MKMRALVNTGPGRLELHQVSRPEPGPGQVLVRTAACGICATDLEMIAGWKRTSFPSIPGHEWSGVVEQVGTGTDRGLVGRPCVGENILADGSEIGFEHPGGYGEYFITEAANLVPLPAGFPLETACLIEPVAVCLHGMQRLGPGPYTSVLLFGDGPIGLLLVTLCKMQGARTITLVGGRDTRLALARDRGASATVNYHRLDEGLANGIRQTAGRDFPLILESSGNVRALEAALELVAQGGKILVLGDYGDQRAGFAWNTLLHREAALVGSNTGKGNWKEAVALATGGKAGLEELITHRIPVEGFEKGLRYMRDRKNGCIKVVMNWGNGIC